MPRPVRLLLALVLAAGTACSGGDELVGTSWQAVQLGPRPALPDVVSTISFDGGEVGGNGGCNSYSGTYEASSGSGAYGGGATTLSIRDIVSTQIGCEDLVASQERYFFDSLEATATYAITVDRLELLDDDAEMLLAFVRTRT